jgi:uncharacterized protein (UPF0332 family)
VRCDGRGKGTTSPEPATAQESKRHLKSARDLLAADDFADSVSRSYYAVFQAARALLAVEGLESRKHSGVVSLFNRHVVKSGRVEKQIGTVLKDAWRQRELADYSDVAEFTRDEAERLLRDAEVFFATNATLIKAPKS